MGYDLNRFRGPVSSVVICCVCQSVLDDPIQSYNCKHVYCRGCITPILNESGGGGQSSSTTSTPNSSSSNQSLNSAVTSSTVVCPKCKKPLAPSDLEIPKSVKTFVSNLEIKCDYASNGCYQYVKLDDLPGHRESCSFNPENSLTCANNCGAVMRRKEIATHCCLSYLQSVISERDSYIDEVVKECRELRSENRRLKLTNGKLKEENDKQRDEIRKLKNELDSKKGITSLLKFDLLYSQSKAVSEEHRAYIRELKTKGLISSNKVFESMILVDINNFTTKESNTRKA